MSNFRKLNKFTKLFSITASCVSLALFLSACSLIPGTSGNQTITLKYWGLWESSTTIDQVISDYKKIKPNVNIVYEKHSPQQYRETLQSFIGSGKGPDVFTFHNTWVSMLRNELSPMPSGVISEKEFSQTYYPTAFLDLRNSAKQLIGIPDAIDGLGLYWNQDIFNAAGISNPPTTWQELSQIAARLTVRDSSGSIRTAGIAIGTSSNVDHFSDILGMMIMQNGGDPKAPIDKASADALDYYTNFARGPNRVWDSTLPSSTVAFAGGNLAMYLAPSWRAAEIKNANPLLKFQISPVPQLEGGRITWSSYWASGVSSKSQHQKEAWEFTKYLHDDQTLIKLYSDAAKSPGRLFGEPYPKVALAQKLASDSLVGAYVTDGQYARSFPMASQTFDNGINDQIIKAYEDAINSVIQGNQTSTALQTAAKNIANIIAKYNSAPTK